jgi:hypothetical protein
MLILEFVQSLPMTDSAGLRRSSEFVFAHRVRISRAKKMHLFIQFGPQSSEEA